MAVKWYSLRVGVDPMFSDPCEFLVGVDFWGKLKMTMYLLMWIGGYVSTHLYYYYASGSFFCDLFASTSSSSFSFDLLFCGVAILIWMGNDFFQMGFSIYTYTAFLILSFSVAISVTVPFYLFLRVSREYKSSAPEQLLNDDPPAQKPKVVNFIPVALYTACIVYWFLGPSPFPRPKLCG